MVDNTQGSPSHHTAGLLPPGSFCQLHIYMELAFCSVAFGHTQQCLGLLLAQVSELTTGQQRGQMGYQGDQTLVICLLCYSSNLMYEAF